MDQSEQPRTSIQIIRMILDFLALLVIVAAIVYIFS